MTENEANAILPQGHCRDTDDHDAHQFVTSWRRGHGIEAAHCPGRHTGHGFVTDQPIAHPMDDDPFAGCDDDRDLWADADYQRDATK